MTREQQIKQAIALLEKVTNAKVLLEFPEAAADQPQGLNKRRIGAKKRLVTMGLDDLTPEQYAVVYFCAVIGKVNFPEPYRSMTFQQIADAAGIKFSTLQMNGDIMRKVKKGEAPDNASPKTFEAFERYSGKPKDICFKDCVRAFEDTKKKNDPNLIGKVSLPMSPEQLERINAKRASLGKGPVDDMGKPVNGPAGSDIAEAFKAMNKKRIAEGKAPISVEQFKEHLSNVIKARIEESTGKKVKFSRS